MKSFTTSILSIGLIFACQFVAAQWNQIGGDIEGQSEGDNAGYSVAINSTGNRVVVGSRNANDVDGYDAGQIRAFQLLGDNWMQMGADLDGEVPGDWCGHSVAMNASGTIIATGCIAAVDEEGWTTGSVSVYTWVGAQWLPMGETIWGLPSTLNFATFFGYSISLSDDGYTLAIGGPGKWTEDGFPDIGYVEVYHWNGSNWELMGESLFGDEPGGDFGFSVDLSADGTSLVVGSVDFGEPFAELGKVQVFKWTGNEWLQQGQAIIGVDEGEDLGASVSISADGNVIASGAPGYVIGSENIICQTRVFEWTGNDWEQRGEDIMGEEQADESGASICLFDNGGRIAISASSASLSGSVRVFDWDGQVWTQSSNTIIGDQFMEFMQSLDVSRDGSTLIAGSFGFDPNGRARVFRDQNWTDVRENEEDDLFSLYPNPAKDALFLEVEPNHVGSTYALFDVTGRLVLTGRITQTKTLINVADLKQGVYLLSTREGEVMRFVKE